MPVKPCVFPGFRRPPRPLPVTGRELRARRQAADEASAAAAGGTGPGGSP